MPHKQKYRDYWKKNLQYLSVLLVSRFTPRPPPAVVEMVDWIRIPSGAGKAHEISA